MIELAPNFEKQSLGYCSRVMYQPAVSTIQTYHTSFKLVCLQVQSSMYIDSGGLEEQVQLGKGG